MRSIQHIFVMFGVIGLAQLASAQSWTPLSPSGTPPAARGLHGTTGVYDATNNRMIVFGGRDSNGNNLNDVWILTNANGLGGASQWINLIPNGAAGSPPARSGHSAAYDSAHNMLIIFGGCSGYCTPALNDVWTLSNANGLGGTPVWTQLSVTGSSPSPRTNAAMAYDPDSNRLWVYSGQDGSPDPCSTTGDVWTLSDANGLSQIPSKWTSPMLILNNLSSPPPGVSGAAVAAYPAGGGMTLFGGSTRVNGVCRVSNGAFSVTWSSGSFPALLDALTVNGAAGSPPARSYASAVYDATGGRTLIFGGEDQNGTFLNDVWSLAAPSLQWSQLSPTGTAPAARAASEAIFDSANQRMTIFGGENASGVLNDVAVLSAPGISGMGCSANYGEPNIVRAGGLAEAAGDLILDCVGGVPTPPGQPIPEYTVTLMLNTNVTSPPISQDPSLSSALLMIDEPFPANPVPLDALPFLPMQPPQILCQPLGSICSEAGTGGTPAPYQTQPNVFVAKRTGAQTLQWTVPIDPPGLNFTRVIRLTNIRIDANQLGIPSATMPTTARATVSIQGSTAVPVLDAQEIVGIGVQGLVPTAPADDPIWQCVPHNTALVGGSGMAAFDFNVQLTEGFPHAWMFRNAGTLVHGTQYPEPLAEQNVPGFWYHTETGFYSPSLFTPAPEIGLADTGTRIRVQFGQVPLGVRLFVPTTITMTSPYYAEGAPPGELRLVQANQAGVSSSSGYQPIAPTGMVGDTPVAEVTYAWPGPYAVYEVVYSDPSILETATIPVAVAFQAAPWTGKANVTPSLAPLGWFGLPSVTAPQPRFVEMYSALPAFSIQSCPASTLSATIASKSGPANARVWNLQVNSGADAATGAQIKSLTVTPEFGATCTPTVTSPAFPDSLGSLPANGSITAPVVMDFSSCANSKFFTAIIQLTANNGVSNKTVGLFFQAP